MAELLQFKVPDLTDLKRKNAQFINIHELYWQIP